MSARAEPCQTPFICRVKIVAEKNPRFLEPRVMLCVLAGRRRKRKDCVIAKLRPDPAISASDVVCAV